MTQVALFQIYSKRAVSVLKDSGIPLYGLHLYKLDDPRFVDLFASGLPTCVQKGCPTRKSVKKVRPEPSAGLQGRRPLRDAYR